MRHNYRIVHGNPMMDIRTLALVVSLANLLQVIVMAVQYRMDKTYPGPGWWTLGLSAFGLGYLFNFIRDESSLLGLGAIVANNACFIGGMLLLHVGILRFLGRRARLAPLLVFYGLSMAIVVHFTLVDPDLAARRVNLSLAIALFSFLMTHALFSSAIVEIRTTVNLLVLSFAAYGLFMVVRGMTPVLGDSVGGLFTPSLLQVATYLGTLIATMLWTFGFVLLINQRLRDAFSANERQLQDIIDFLPDATLVLDARRRVIVWNRAIETMTGIPAARMIGRGDHAYTIPFYGDARPSLTDAVFEDNERIAERYTHVVRNGDSLAAEVFCPALHGNRGAWIFAKASPLHDHRGRVVGVIESIRDITERKHLEQELRRQATTDELTGVCNRRHFLDLAALELKRARRHGHDMSMALIDFDHFKQVNDTHGHAVGDAALSTLTRICRATLRAIDVVARFGGDEFVLLLPETPGREGLLAVERIRQALADSPLAVDGRTLTIRITAGVASLRADDASLDQLLARADRALYRAKVAGRDRVMLDEGAGTPGENLRIPPLTTDHS